MKGGAGFHVLDKDLRRISHAEAAQAHAFRPVWRLGLGVLAVVGALLLVLGLWSDAPPVLTLGTGLIVAGWLGMAIGSNDVANSLGPAVGAGAIRVLPGLILVAVAGLAGALLAGGAVTQRLASGLHDNAALVAGGQGATVMVAALVAGASWITLASGIGLPVSTSHSIVGGIAGASAAAAGLGAVDWSTLATITAVWVMTPLVAGLVAGVLLILLRTHLIEVPDRARAARRWLPWLVAMMTALFSAYVLRLADVAAPVARVAAVAGLGGAGFVLTLRAVQAETRRNPDRPSVKRLLRPALVMAVAIMGFAHGANDVGNIAGPLSVILRPGAAVDAGTAPLAVLLGGGLMIGAGALLFGRRLVGLVGSGITRLNAGRAFCVSLATATTVIAASSAGLPVSTTHVAVGGIFGVGFAREWRDRRRDRSREALPEEELRRRVLIRRSHVLTITAAWLVTVPVTATLAAAVTAVLLP